MLLQTNSYIVPKDRRSEHTRLLRKFRHTLLRLGCESFEVYEQVGAQWAAGEATGRFVQIMRFRDRAQQLEVQEGEKSDPIAQQLIQEFCALINFPYQQQQGLFAVGFYTSALPVAPATRTTSPRPTAQEAGQPEQASSTESDAPEQAHAPMLELPAPADKDSGDQGSSLLDFNALQPAADEPSPLRLTSDSDEAHDVEVTANGEHSDSFADATPEDEPLTDADREAVLGELTGDDVAESTDPDNAHRRNDAGTKSHAN